MKPHRLTPALAMTLLALIGPIATEAAPQQKSQGPRPKAALAGATAKTFESRDAMEKYFADQFADLNRQRVAALADLAEKSKGDEADGAFAELFNAAIATDNLDEAEKAADDYRARKEADPSIRALAVFVSVFAKTDRGEYDAAHAELQRFVSGHKGPEGGVDPQTFYAVGESYLRRLMRNGRYDEAQKAAGLFADVDNPEIQRHFSARASVLKMLGKPAPPIDGRGVDGEGVSTADLKGKVILVDFWATWCGPCVSRIAHDKALADRYADKDFAVIGVNVDLARQGIANPEEALSGVRRFMIEHRVDWPNVVQPPDGEIASSFGVTQIPANFLIDQDGKIVRVELDGPALDSAVAELLGGPAAPDADGSGSAPTTAPAAPK